MKQQSLPQTGATTLKVVWWRIRLDYLTMELRDLVQTLKNTHFADTEIWDTTTEDHYHPCCTVTYQAKATIRSIWQPTCDVVWCPFWQPFIKLPVRPCSLTLLSWDSRLAAPALTGRTRTTDRKPRNASNQSKVKGMYSTITRICGNKVGYITTQCTFVILISLPNSFPVLFHVCWIPTQTVSNLNRGKESESSADKPDNSENCPIAEYKGAIN